MKPADIVFFLPMESKLEEYLKRSLRYSLFLTAAGSVHFIYHSIAIIGSDKCRGKAAIHFGFARHLPCEVVVCRDRLSL